MDPSSVTSTWVQAEALLANNLNKLITLRSHDLDLHSIPLPYNVKHTVLVTDRDIIYTALLQQEGLVPFGDGLRAELMGLRQELDDAIRSASEIAGYMPDRDLPRFDITSVNIRYTVRKNGDTEVNALFELECMSTSAHIWTYWIEADAESTEIRYLRQLNFQVLDVETGRTLTWLLTHNAAKTKILAIFFPEMSPGTKKKIKISYFWPGYMKKLIDLGAVNFEWRYITQNPDRLAYFKSEWQFDQDFEPLECRIVGNRAETASIGLESHENFFSWIYQDPSAIFKQKYAVEFVRS